jgi:hypothetical protein
MCVILCLGSVELGFGAVLPGSTSGSPSVSVTLATVGIGSARWRLVASEGRQSAPRRACFGVGYKPPSSSSFFFSSATSCSLPKIEGPSDGSGSQTKSVVGVAFPANVVRLHFDLGSFGARNIALRLLATAQAQKIHVERFRWGYLKLVGDFCMREVIGYDAAGRVVYRGKEDPAIPCQIE